MLYYIIPYYIVSGGGWAGCWFHWHPSPTLTLIITQTANGKKGEACAATLGWSTICITIGLIDVTQIILFLFVLDIGLSLGQGCVKLVLGCCWLFFWAASASLFASSRSLDSLSLGLGLNASSAGLGKIFRSTLEERFRHLCTLLDK